MWRIGNCYFSYPVRIPLRDHSEIPHQIPGSHRVVLLARGYPNHMINSKFLEASTLSQRELMFTPNNSKVVNPHPYPFVIPYLRSNKGIKEILDRNWHLIENDPQLQSRSQHTRIHNPVQTNRRLTPILLHSTSLPHQDPTYITQSRT